MYLWGAAICQPASAAIVGGHNQLRVLKVPAPTAELLWSVYRVSSSKVIFPVYRCREHVTISHRHMRQIFLDVRSVCCYQNLKSGVAIDLNGLKLRSMVFATKIQLQRTH
jgi:hypothetical protein